MRAKNDFGMAIQTEPIPFGKYPKTKYELIMNRYEYSFVTSCRSPDECMEIIRGMVNHYIASGKWTTYRIFRTIENGERELIHKSFGNEKKRTILQDDLDILQKEGVIERAVW